MCFFVSHRLADFVVGDVGRTRLNRGQKAGSVRVRAPVERPPWRLYACFVWVNDGTPLWLFLLLSRPQRSRLTSLRARGWERTSTEAEEATA